MLAFTWQELAALQSAEPGDGGEEGREGKEGEKKGEEVGREERSGGGGKEGRERKDYKSSAPQKLPEWAALVLGMPSDLAKK